MRVRVDLDLCQGHGVCESEAPAVFELGKSLQVTVVDERPADELRAMVETAARFCPTSAIRITEKE